MSTVIVSRTVNAVTIQSPGPQGPAGGGSSNILNPVAGDFIATDVSGNLYDSGFTDSDFLLNAQCVVGNTANTGVRRRGDGTTDVQALNTATGSSGGISVGGAQIYEVVTGTVRIVGNLTVTGSYNGLGTAALANTGTGSGNVPVLDGSGLLPTSTIPPLAISDTFVVASQAAMLALTAQKGDVAVRSDQNKTYLLSTNSPGTLADWIQILTPGAVVSVQGFTGAVSLTSTDIPQGTNLYFTNAAAAAAAPVQSVASKTGAVTLAAADIASGVFSTARLGTGTANSGTYLRGDGTWAGVAGGGSVTSVDMTVPSWLSVSGNPITGAGTLAVSAVTQIQNTVLSGPTSGANATPTFRVLVAGDIPTLTLAKISDAGSAASKTAGTAAGNVALLDGSGLLPTSCLPPLAINKVDVVASQAAMLALTSEMGDMAIRTDTNKSYVLSTNSPGTLADWKEITASGAVTSVNSQTGTVVLTTANVTENTNLYYTTARVNADAPNVTLGTANGLSLSGQQISLALAVAGGTNGALSGADKTLIDGITTTYAPLASPSFSGTVTVVSITQTGKYTQSIVNIGTQTSAISIDASLGNQFKVTLGGNCTVGVPSSPTNGQIITVLFRQDATGSRTLSFNTGAGGFRFNNTVPSSITASTTANATDVATFRYDAADSKWDFVAWARSDTTAATNFIIMRGVEIGDGTNVITAGNKDIIQIPMNATIVGWSLFSADGTTSGSITVDVKRAAVASFGTFVSMVGAGTKPALSSAVSANNNAPASWTSVAITADDYIQFEVTGTPATVKQVVLNLKLKLN